MQTIFLGETKKMRSEALISRIKNNPIAALLIVLGTIVIALSTFTDATKNLLSVFSESMVTNIDGKWISQEITDNFNDRNKFYLHFDFVSKDDILLGTVWQKSATNRYNVGYGILNGSVKNNIISFDTMHRYQKGGSDKDYTFKKFFIGTVFKDKIEFVLQSDYPGDLPQKFFAKPK